ncbi:MAG: Arm DNA-binding domain-containing protein [bacterium]
MHSIAARDTPRTVRARFAVTQFKIVAFIARWVRALQPTERRVEYFDETLTGLALRVELSGRKTWRVAFRAAGRWRRMNIGSVQLIDLAKASGSRDPRHRGLR